MPKVGSPEVAIVSAIAALSCNNSQGRTPNDNESAASSVVVVAPEAPPKSDEKAADESPAPSVSPKLDALRTSEAWTRFKRLWRELDDIAPLGTNDPVGRSSYAGSLDDKRASKLSQQAEEDIGRMRDEQLLSEGEADFLRRAIQLRIQNMTHGFMHLMMMHRMPFPFETAQASSVERLERKLDTVVALRSEGKIGTAEFTAALDQVQRESITLYVVTKMRGGGYGAPAVEPTDGEAFLAHISKKLEQARADAGVDPTTAQLVEESKVLVPAIRELLAELER